MSAANSPIKMRLISTMKILLAEWTHLHSCRWRVRPSQDGKPFSSWASLSTYWYWLAFASIETQSASLWSKHNKPKHILFGVVIDKSWWHIFFAFCFLHRMIYVYPESRVPINAFSSCGYRPIHLRSFFNWIENRTSFNQRITIEDNNQLTWNYSSFSYFFTILWYCFLHRATRL